MMPDYGWFSFANKIDRPDLVSPLKLGYTVSITEVS
jgi:hypothetical protein